MRIAYVRVSSADQNEARQIEALKNMTLKMVYRKSVRERYEQT